MELKASAAGGERPRPAARRAAPDRGQLDIARMNDNELILFDRERQESWTIYPPRSGYDFLKRPSQETVLVEHHP